MRIFAVGTKILGGGAGQHLGGLYVPPPRPKRRTAPGCTAKFLLTYVRVVCSGQCTDYRTRNGLGIAVQAIVPDP